MGGALFDASIRSRCLVTQEVIFPVNTDVVGMKCASAKALFLNVFLSADINFLISSDSHLICPLFLVRFFLMYLINKDETEHTGQVRHHSSFPTLSEELVYPSSYY